MEQAFLINKLLSAGFKEIVYHHDTSYTAFSKEIETYKFNKLTEINVSLEEFPTIFVEFIPEKNLIQWCADSVCGVYDIFDSNSKEGIQFIEKFFVN